MKQFIANRTGTTPVLEEVPNEKEKVYTDLASAEADITNIAENEFVDTLDEEVVKEDEIVTKSDFPRMLVPDYANPIKSGMGATGWTATEDCYVIVSKIMYVSSSSSPVITISIDNHIVATSVSSSYSSVRVVICTFSGYLKKGQSIISMVDNVGDSSATFRAYPLVTL